jgi:porin
MRWGCWTGRVRRMAIFAAAVGVMSASTVQAGDWRDPGLKTLNDHLAEWGVAFSVAYIGETLGNASGGIRRGAIYEGRLDVGIDVDLEKAVGWNGATFHANAFQIHGPGLSRDYIGNIMLVSGIEALPSTRLYEFWIEQSLFDGRLLVKVGQQPSDTEFIDSKYDDIFVNSALGWPGITGTILPAGGPSPPLAVPGVRVKATISNEFTAYLAVFNGSAAARGPMDPQISNANGLAFRVNDPPWIIGQLKYNYNLGPTYLPGSFTGGGWVHLSEFEDQRLTPELLSQADPSGSGEPLMRRGNRGIFAVYEQRLLTSTISRDKGIGIFARVSASPSDRNLISFYLDGGLQWSGFSEARPDDRIGIAMTYARISDGARGLDRDTQIFNNIASPIRDFEAVFEATYIAMAAPGVAVQPVFQYVIHPGGGIADPNNPTQRIKDAAVFGVRPTITF